MQAIHFALEGHHPADQASPGEGLHHLLRSSLLESLYLPTYAELLELDNDEDLLCDQLVSNISISG